MITNNANRKNELEDGQKHLAVLIDEQRNLPGVTSKAVYVKALAG